MRKIGIGKEPEEKERLKIWKKKKRKENQSNKNGECLSGERMKSRDAWGSLELEGKETHYLLRPEGWRKRQVWKSTEDVGAEEVHVLTMSFFFK